MTREEFARRWLSPAAASAREIVVAPRRVRLTDIANRTFREKAPQPSRLVRTGRFLKRWAVAAVAAGVFFGGMAMLLVKLTPYVTDYVSTYLAP